MYHKKIAVIWLSIVMLFSYVVIVIEIVPLVRASTLYVGGGGPGNYTSINNAINAATDGHTVYVYSGTYSETLDIEKPILLIGENKYTTIIDGEEHQTIYIDADNVHITGFTIKNRGQGIDNCGNNVTIAGNIFSENTDEGIFLISSNNVKIENNTFYENSIIIYDGTLKDWNTHTIENNTANGRPIYYYKNTNGINVPSDAAAVILANCTDVMIDGVNTSNVDVGILAGFCTNLSVKNSIILNNRDSGVRLYSSYNNTIKENNISCNKEGLLFRDSSNNNSVMNNNIMMNSGYGIYTDSNFSNNAIMYNNISMNKIYGVHFGEYCSLNNIIGNFMQLNSFEPTDYSYYGILFESYSCNNTIIDNRILSNGMYGIRFYSQCNNNRIKNNDISGHSYGIYIQNSNNNLIKSNNISWNIGGISVGGYSANSTIMDNTIMSNDEGIVIGSSINITIKNNTLYNDSIVIISLREEYWNCHIIENNTANGRPIYYYKDVNRIAVPSDVAAVILVNCTDIMIDGVNTSNVDVGILSGFCSNLTIKNSQISNNSVNGIRFVISNGNISRNNILQNSEEGIRIFNRSSGIIYNNNIKGNGYEGINIRDSDNWIIYVNNISENKWNGIRLSNSQNNLIYYNHIAMNQRYGIYLDSSDGNVLFYNNLFNNTNQAYDSILNNLWSLSYPYGGNYWSDYNGNDNFSGPNQSLPNSDGLGDIPYQGRGYIDSYPLIELLDISKSTRPKPSVPSSPQNIQISAGDGYVYLKWDAPLISGGFTITDYIIYRGNNSFEEKLLITTTNQYYNDTTVFNGQIYYYRISAVNRMGESSLSDEKSATPSYPPDPDKEIPWWFFVIIAVIAILILIGYIVNHTKEKNKRKKD